jgi:hypothetical protein
LAARGGYDRRRDKGWTEFDWFVADGVKHRGGLGATKNAAHTWRRYKERYEEVAWTRGEIRRALAGAGLRVRGAWDLVRFARGEPWAKNGCRVFWLARRG